MNEFFKSSLVSKYIKYLLSYTPLPLYPVINHNQYMVEGCNYIHRNKVLRCNQSGVFSSMTHYFRNLDYLYCGDDKVVSGEEWSNTMTVVKSDSHKSFSTPLLVTNDLVCLKDSIRFAQYEVVGEYTFGEDTCGLTHTFVSNTSFYDSDTHRYLGEYLRLLNNYFGLDLLPLYNCYSYESSTNISVYDEYPYVKNTGIKSRKVMLVPIKFNTEYTIALDCSSTVLIKPVIFSNGRIVQHSGVQHFYERSNCYKLNQTQFSKPFSVFIDNNEYVVSNENDKPQTVQQFESHLYLAIQVPDNLNSTLVVLEGNYLNKQCRYIADISSLDRADAHQVMNCLNVNPSLLHPFTVNNKSLCSFSPKLISYLVGNTVDNRESVSANISRIENQIGYDCEYSGEWNNKLHFILYNRYRDLCEKYSLADKDILGYLDADVEDIIRRGYLKYATK